MSIRKSTIIRFTLFGLLVMSTSLISQATLSVNGQWNQSITSLDLVAGAGSALQDTYTSALEQVTLDIEKYSDHPGQGGGPAWNWQIDIRRQNINWHPDLQLWVRRTGDGTTRGGNMTGGDTFQQVTSNSQFFLQGKKDHSAVPIQYELRGVSVFIPADQYNTEIIYTLTEY